MSVSEKLILMSARGAIAPMSSKDALAIEAALSTDAEPVAFVCAADMELLAKTPEGLDISIAPKPYPELGMNMALYAEPVKTAPGVAVKADEDLPYHCDVCTVPGYGDAPCSPLCDRPALSAQVQDVAVPEAKPENKAEPDRSKFPYVWECPKPDDAVIHKVINAYMGAQDREYDIDQFRYYKANWQGHYTLNQHMKEAVDACVSPASKHGEEA